MGDPGGSDGEADSDGCFETPDPEEFLEENSTAKELGSVDGRPLVPEGVLRGIEDILNGRTAGVDDIEAVLNYEA